ncbi:MAG: TonB-dependent receptor [Verrucomicrobia bacterium]|nr:TonB-dependent receptor [Verrucomicrobiota bacterium]
MNSPTPNPSSPVPALSWPAVRALAITAGLSLASLPAAAPVTADQLKLLELEELMQVKVVTATQMSTPVFELPYLVSALGRADRDRTLPRTLPVWIEGQPGIMIQKTANGQQSPYLRGFTGFRTLLLVDGVRLNNSFFREGPNQYATTIDALAVERVEVVKGPASVLYGSDSVGGTIHALSGSLLDSRLAGWERTVTTRAGTADRAAVARGEFAGPVGADSALRLGATRRWFGELRGGADVGRQGGTDYDEAAFDLRWESRLPAGWRLVLAHQGFAQEDVNRSHSTPEGTDWLGLSSGSERRRDTDQRRDLTYGRLQLRRPQALVEEAEFTLSRHGQEETQERVRSDGRRDVSAADVVTHGFTARLQGSTGAGTWLGGASYHRDRVDTRAERYLADGAFDRFEVQGPVADDSRYDLSGVYLQHRFRDWQGWHATVRGRFDAAELRAGRLLDPVANVPASFYGRWYSWLGSVRVTYQRPTSSGLRWMAFGGISDGFRAPNLSDVSRLDTAASGQVETPSTQVRPEKYRVAEVGLRLHGARGDLTATLFNTEIDGMITRVPTGRFLGRLAELTKRNSGNGYVQGAEAEGRWVLGRGVSARAAWTLQRGEIDVFPTANPADRRREPLSRLMPDTTRVGLEWRSPSRKWWAEAGVSLVRRQARLSTADLADRERIPPGGTPGYSVGTVRAGWTPRPGVSVSLGVENVTDADYRIHGSGLNEPGRNLVVGSTFTF